MSIHSHRGGGPQDVKKNQMLSMTQKSDQTCSFHSPDGEYKFLMKKIDPFMTNRSPKVAPLEVTSDRVKTNS